MVFNVLPFICRYELKDMSREVGVSAQTSVDWASFCRQVCIDAVITQVRPIGGPGKIVEIDESMFGKMKHGRG
jgi:hypothetical protein